MEVKLWENEIPYFNPEFETPNLMETYLIESEKPLPCVVIYPGGGYTHRAAHEGAPIAEYFNKMGIQAVVVEYRVNPNVYPAPLADAQRAIKLVRAHADEWKIDPNRVVTLGFSAGGNLSAATAVLEDVSLGENAPDSVDSESAIPNGAVLCYALTAFSNEWGVARCGESFVGEKYKYVADYFSLEKHVSDKTPPIFMWHTSDDSVVNVKNSLVFAESLRDHGVKFEMHIYPSGRHGLGLAKDYEDIRHWAEQAAAWIYKNI